MIGLDEYNLKSPSHPTSVTGDITEAQYIETFLSSSSRVKSSSRVLIDIVRPQPLSKQRTPAKSSVSAKRTLRTNSANNWSR